jgi:hypothetical protein
MLALLAVALLSTACSFRPIPLVAQAGTTIVLPLAGEALHGAYVGYESEVTRRRGLYDDQRGGLEFALVDDLAAPAYSHALVTRLVTRVQPDPATPAAIANGATLHDFTQILALVDVPVDVPPGDFYVSIRRRRRGSASGGADELLPAMAPSFTRLRVLPSERDGSGAPVARFTPLEAIVAGRPFGNAESDALGLYPLPKVVVQLGALDVAAASLEVVFPPAKLAVRSVFEEQHPGRGSVVRWQLVASDTLRIQLIDPDASVRALAIAFEPLDPFGVGRAQPADFQVRSARLYDERGAWIPGGAAVTELR